MPYITQAPPKGKITLIQMTAAPAIISFLAKIMEKTTPCFCSLDMVLW